MAASSRGFATPFRLELRSVDVSTLPHREIEFRKCRRRVSVDGDRIRLSRIRCCCSGSTGSGKSVEKAEEWRFDSKKSSHRVRIQAMPSMPFASPQSHFVSKQEKFYPRCTPRHSGPQSRDTPPKRDTGIANEKDWGINLLSENINESGTNEDGSAWYRESGEDLGENGYRCRWTRMGGQSHDGSSEWKEMWWEKSDWTGYKELGVEKSGRNAEGDSWWETWQEVLHQDEWSNLARIERSAQKQAKSGTENAGWYEKWWEKYDAKGSTEKGAHKYGRLNEQSWWEKWGEHYDGRGSVLKWTDKWAETELGTKWGDKWEEKFFAGIGSRQGETWHLSPSGDRWSRTWGEEHFGNGKVHKYGKSTTGESWDIVVDEETYYEAEPHYGWADVVGNSSQLLSIEPLERPPGVYPNLDFGTSPPPPDDDSPDTAASSQ
ncbi:hypothetical protein VitviT2T_026935 [Vitis vinifera]|uniref:Inactive purple acid phosphatase-like protein n=2 Tax=Vitis vinifera TaxID=29760 RepID=F6H0B2_VITVI|nr:protein EARLY STARVATION 1, chloroplastic [Vitis vinifera]WKA09271.1 hypothetical protein VitviT2T_026935 [Vitis vinifera]|eukprot:XP_002285931.1 PREDICTED: uncharacterized protein LOC100252277 [Vitis vinifera]